MKPVALYNCEIWAADMLNRVLKYDTNKIKELAENDVYEKLHNKVCKSNLLVRKNITNIACRSELGNCSLSVDINTQVVKYFGYFENLPANRYILKDAFICSKENNNSNFSWHKYVQTPMEKNKINSQNYPRTQGSKLTKSESKKIKTCFKPKYLDFIKT